MHFWTAVPSLPHLRLDIIQVIFLRSALAALKVFTACACLRAQACRDLSVSAMTVIKFLCLAEKVFVYRYSEPLFVRMKVVDDFKRKTLQQIVEQYFVEKTKVECDGYHSYRSLENVTLSYSCHEAGNLHWLHTAISNFKTFLLGTCHGRCVHLQSCMDDFFFRFNRRNTGNLLFLRLTRAVALSYALLS